MARKSRLAVLVVLSLLIVALASGTVLAAMKTMKVGKEQAVSMRKPESSLAAWEILEKGGNAFDAIVAGQAVNGFADASMNGLMGADMVAHMYVAADRKVYTLDAEGTAPQLASIEWYNKNNDGVIPASDGLLSGTVPGIVAGWILLLDKWGTMTLSEVVAPALRLAEQGFPTNSFPSGSKLKKYPSSVATFDLNADGTSKLKAWDLLKYPAAAATLRKLCAAEQAALKAGKSRHDALMAARDRFYKGDIAQEMGAFSEKNGGLFRYEDFANYEAKLREPVSINYRGYTVWGNTSSSQGPTLLFWLNILKNFDMKSIKQNSLEYWHLMVESGKLAYADREWTTDVDFYPVPFKGLLSDKYGADRAKLIDMTKANNEFRIGNPWPYQGEPTPPNPWGLTSASTGKSVQMASVGDAYDPDSSVIDGDTSGVSCADKWGNVVVMTPSLHSGWGTGVVMGNTGVIFNCRGDYYYLDPLHPNALKPGERPCSTLMTTMVTDSQGRVAYTVASPGGDDQPQIAAQFLVSVIDYGKNVQDAIETPRMDIGSFPGKVFPHTFYPGRVEFEDRVGMDIANKLIEMGHKVVTPLAGSYSKGSQHVLGFDYSHAGYTVYFAGADPRSTIDAIAK